MKSKFKTQILQYRIQTIITIFTNEVILVD